MRRMPLCLNKKKEQSQLFILSVHLIRESWFMAKHTIRLFRNLLVSLLCIFTQRGESPTGSHLLGEGVKYTGQG